MDQLSEFILLLTLSVGAHMLVAYVLASRAAVARLKAYLRTGEFTALITTRVGPALADWADSEEGGATVGALIDRASEEVKVRLTAWLQGQAGGAARKGQAAAEKVALANLTLRTGNPVYDGILAAMPDDLKRGFIRKVVGSVRGATEEELGLSDAPPSEGWR